MSHVVRVQTPEGLAPPTGYSHVAWGTGRLIAVSGQVGYDENGVLAGPDAVAQARQAFENMRRCLAAAGAGFEDVVKLTYFLTDIADLARVRVAREEFIPADRIPASSAMAVVALFRPEVVVEIEAWAVVPEDRG